jgi:hypothetical protein
MDDRNDLTRGRRVTALGETLTLRQWAARTGLSVAAVRWRLRAGWDPAVAVTAAPRPGRRAPA